MRQKAITILGNYAIDKRSNSGKLNERRIKIMIDFMEKNKTDKIEIVKNNVCMCGPRRKNKKDCVKLGGQHGYYHLWAICINEEKN